MVLREERQGLEKRFFDLSVKVVAEEGLQLYDMDYFPGNGEWRIFIYNEGTDTAVIEDCVRVDKALTPYVEESDWMPENLTLQVSSPGIDRSLRTRVHFERVLGKSIKIVLIKRLAFEFFPDLPKSLKGEKKVVAKLVSLNDDGLILNYRDEFTFSLGFSDIKKANQEPEF